RLAELVPVAWLVGIGPLSLVILFFGRISLVRWWTVGLLVIALGTAGAARLGARLRTRNRGVLEEVRRSPLSLVSAGVILLSLAWAAIYTSAPEIQYDALYGKAFLPAHWAQTGYIGSIPTHVQLNIGGWFQVLAVPGHLLGGPTVGRYMQLLGLLSAACLL